MHDVNDEDGDVAERAASRTQVSEGFVAWCVDNEKTREFELLNIVLAQHRCLALDRFDREVGGTNLLSDTSGFSLLNVRLSNLSSQRRRMSVSVYRMHTDAS